MFPEPSLMDQSSSAIIAQINANTRRPTDIPADWTLATFRVRSSETLEFHRYTQEIIGRANYYFMGGRGAEFSHQDWTTIYFTLFLARAEDAVAITMRFG
ncbi:MAG: hypothetical protein EOP83_09180 [Verrucomicrobiaceae bacterium]|nr:MAG: hypothetical protein EOP83_09180 [Verrucomicrobiaceae bacterium]